jgi:hypothetical protein
LLAAAFIEMERHMRFRGAGIDESQGLLEIVGGFKWSPRVFVKISIVVVWHIAVGLASGRMVFYRILWFLGELGLVKWCLVDFFLRIKIVPAEERWRYDEAQWKLGFLVKLVVRFILAISGDVEQAIGSPLALRRSGCSSSSA